MSLVERLTTEMKVAMKAKDKLRLSTIRMLLAAVKGEEKRLMRDLEAAEELTILTREAKRRAESIKAFTEGGRDELAAKEKAELVILQEYLPKPYSREEARDVVVHVIKEVGATSKKDMGNVMRVAMPKLKGRFPGGEVRTLVMELLE